MGSEDNNLKEEYLGVTRTRKCIQVSFSHQLYLVLHLELHSMEEYNPVLLLLPSGDKEQSSVLLSTPLSGTQSIQRQKLKFVPQNMRRFAEQRPSACASQPQDRSAPQCMRNSVKQFTGMNVWSSTRLSMSPTQRLSAPQNTRKTVSTNGRAMAMTRCGLQLLELARIIHMKHVLMCQSQKLSRSPTLCAGIFQNRSVWMFPDKIVCRFPTRFASTSLYKSAKMCQDKHASRFTKKCQTELAGRFQRRSVKTQEVILMELLLLTDLSLLMQERMKSQSSFKKE